MVCNGNVAATNWVSGALITAGRGRAFSFRTRAGNVTNSGILGTFAHDRGAWTRARTQVDALTMPGRLDRGSSPPALARDADLPRASFEVGRGKIQVRAPPPLERLDLIARSARHLLRFFSFAVGVRKSAILRIVRAILAIFDQACRGQYSGFAVRFAEMSRRGRRL